MVPRPTYYPGIPDEAYKPKFQVDFVQSPLHTVDALQTYPFSTQEQDHGGGDFFYLDRHYVFCGGKDQLLGDVMFKKETSWAMTKVKLK